MIATVGGSQGLYAAFQSVLDPGEDALVFSPYWTPIGDLVTGTQARLLLVPTISARRNGIRNTLAQFSTPKTRAIYYNTPQNPSGLVFTRAEAEEVAAFAIERDLIVIADEAYEDLVYDGEHVSIASLPGMAERTITCFTFSKTYAMTGWRAGYTVAKDPFMTAIARLSSIPPTAWPRRCSMQCCRRSRRPNRRSTHAARSIASAAICWLAGCAKQAWSANLPRVRSMHFPILRRSTRAAAPPLRSCSRRRTLLRFPASFLARRARDIYGSAMRSPLGDRGLRGSSASLQGLNRDSLSCGWSLCDCVVLNWSQIFENQKLMRSFTDSQ